MSLHIVTLAEMKAELGLADTADDAVLTRWMEGLQGRFDEHCRRGLLRTADIEEIHNGGDTYLFLSRFPVESVASVHLSAAQDWSAANALESDAFLVNKQRGRLMLAGFGNRWPEGEQNIRVSYTGGFVAAGSTPTAGQTAMPEALRRAFVLQLGFEWRNRANLGKTGVSGQGLTLDISPAKLLPEVEDALATFRRLV